MSFLALGLLFLAGSLVLLAAVMRLRRVAPRAVFKPMLFAAVVLFALTALFDNVMIAAGLFGYGEQALTGVRVGLAPVEDFLYPLCAVLFMPALWWLLGGGTPITAGGSAE